MSARAPVPATGRAWRARRLLAAVLRSAAGVSAVEFALLAPVLIVGAFSTADAGRAIYEKMMISQALRAGAQRAMSGAETDGVRAVLDAVAAENFALAGSENAGSDALATAVEQYCVCTGIGFGQVSCGILCSAGGEPTRFLRLSASKSFQGIILPGFTISGTVDVIAQ